VGGAQEIDFPRALSWLRSRWHIHRLACEGGAELNAALFRQQLVDELHLTFCPKIFGGRTAPTIAEGPGRPNLVTATGFQIKSIRRIGNELFAVLTSL